MRACREYGDRVKLNPHGGRSGEGRGERTGRPRGGGGFSAEKRGEPIDSGENARASARIKIASRRWRERSWIRLALGWTWIGLSAISDQRSHRSDR